MPVVRPAPDMEEGVSDMKRYFLEQGSGTLIELTLYPPASNMSAAELSRVLKVQLKELRRLEYTKLKKEQECK